MDTLRRTPLYAFHERNNARFVPFGGWEMPVQYSGILEEHRIIRSSVGIFDVSHMGEARIRGSQAGEFLDYVMTNRISSVTPSRAVYSLMCNANGGIVDDLIIYCIEKGKDYLLCLNAGNTTKDLDWLKTEIKAFDCSLEDESPQTALLAIQGPEAWNVFTQMDLGLSKLARFEFRHVSWRDATLLISRTGYTGEDGVEIYLPGDRAEELAEALWPLVQEKGGCLAGLGARDSLRLEAGYPLYGHEIDDSISPLEAGLSWAIRWDKPNGFIGQDALQLEKEQGRRRRIIHFIAQGRRIARPESVVYAGDEAIGSVVSGTQSPILNQPIGSALVDIKGLTKGELFAEVRQSRIPLSIARPPLHKSDAI